MERVLVLNQDYTPLEVISWQRAVCKLATAKIEVLEDYADRPIRSPSGLFPRPAVVRNVGRYARRKVRFSRKNILARDMYTCQYCGLVPRKPSGKPALEQLTIDHVVPRSRAEEGWVVVPWSKARVRVSSWENVLTACQACNHRKGAQTPVEAGMRMLRQPRAPSAGDIAWMAMFGVEIPEEWKGYLPAGSPWRDYWDVELESG